MRNLIILLILLMYSISNSQKIWEDEGWTLTARNLNHEGVKSKSKSDLSQLFEQYLEKASSLKELDELKNNYGQKQIVWFKDVLHLFKNLININKVKEFEEIGIDLNNLGFNNIKSKAVFSQIIFTGIVTEHIDTELEYKKKFKIQILEILKSKYFLSEFNKEFLLFYYLLGESNMYYAKLDRKPLEKNRRYIFFIDMVIWEDSSGIANSEFNQNEATIGDFAADNVLYYPIAPYQTPDSVKFNDLIKKYTREEFPPYGFTSYRDRIYNNEIDSLKNFLESYEKINDTRNFFNRSYK